MYRYLSDYQRRRAKKFVENGLQYAALMPLHAHRLPPHHSGTVQVPSIRLY